jgi:hypothetical protein
MADVELCYAPLLDTLEYAASVGGTFKVDLDATYHKTHESSSRNRAYGDVKAVNWRLPPPNIPHKTPRVFHPHENFPSPPSGTPINNEAASVAHCLTHFILPMFKILREEHPHIHLGVYPETTLSIVEDEEDEEGETVWISKAIARVDQIITAWRDGEDPETVLVIEHKRPGTPRRSDWNTITHKLVFNAEEIAKQARKYLHAAIHDVAAMYDSTALVGCKLDLETYPLWHSLERIEMKVFFTDDPDEFLLSLIAMVTHGLGTKRLLNGWKW